MRVLVVEDNALLRHHLKVQLQELGHQVDAAEDAREADYYLGEHLPDIAIVDLGLPDEDGLSLIRRWRSHDVSLPVLVLTAREGWQDKVEVLSAGADDYVTKPFHIEEVAARMQALLRRNSGLASQVISLPPFQVDLSRRELSVNDQPIKLTAFEYTIMETLIRNRGKVVSKDSVALQPPHGSHDDIPLQRCSHRNGQLHARTQEHKDDADLRKDNQREAQSGHGEPCRKIERRRGICRLHHLKRKAMKRDTIIIEDKAVSVTGNDVWMTATEIAGLFHTTVPAVNAAIRAVRKSDVLNDYEVCRYMQLENGLHADVYALEIIIPVAFRVNTYNTHLFRTWLVGKALSQEKRQTYVMFIQNGKAGYC